MPKPHHSTQNSHISHHFDAELVEIHHLAIDMLNLILHQWESAIEGLDEANLKSALEVIAKRSHVLHYETSIDQAILILLAREHPVAIDLRVVLSISKISLAMRYLGEEAARIAQLTLSLYEPRNGTPHAKLLTEIAKISENIRIMLAHLAIVLGNFESRQAHMLMKQHKDFEQEILEAIKHQFAIVNQDMRQIRPALTILQIMNSLEMCVDHCKNLTEYCIFMIDGQDVRHLNS
jgi:phosphate transport system protein